MALGVGVCQECVDGGSLEGKEEPEGRERKEVRRTRSIGDTGLGQGRRPRSPLWLPCPRRPAPRLRCPAHTHCPGPKGTVATHGHSILTCSCLTTSVPPARRSGGEWAQLRGADDENHTIPSYRFNSISLTILQYWFLGIHLGVFCLPLSINPAAFSILLSSPKGDTNRLH